MKTRAFTSDDFTFDGSSVRYCNLIFYDDDVSQTFKFVESLNGLNFFLISYSLSE